MARRGEDPRDLDAAAQQFAATHPPIWFRTLDPFPDFRDEKFGFGVFRWGRTRRTTEEYPVVGQAVGMVDALREWDNDVFGRLVLFMQRFPRGPHDPMARNTKFWIVFYTGPRHAPAGHWYRRPGDPLYLNNGRAAHRIIRLRSVTWQELNEFHISQLVSDLVESENYDETLDDLWVQNIDIEFVSGKRVSANVKDPAPWPAEFIRDEMHAFDLRQALVESPRFGEEPEEEKSPRTPTPPLFLQRPVSPPPLPQGPVVAQLAPSPRRPTIGQIVRMPVASLTGRQRAIQAAVLGPPAARPRFGPAIPAPAMPALPMPARVAPLLPALPAIPVVLARAAPAQAAPVLAQPAAPGARPAFRARVPVRRIAKFDMVRILAARPFQTEQWCARRCARVFQFIPGTKTTPTRSGRSKTSATTCVCSTRWRSRGGSVGTGALC